MREREGEEWREGRTGLKKRKREERVEMNRERTW